MVKIREPAGICGAGDAVRPLWRKAQSELDLYRMGVSFRGTEPAGCGRILCAGVLLAAAAVRADTNFVTVQAQSLTNQFVAYAQVEPVAVLPVRAATAGVIGGLNLLPGTAVRAGAELAHLQGPEIDAMLSQARAAMTSARARLDAAEKLLNVQRQQLAAHLGTHQAVYQAESALAEAHSALDAAQAQLQADRRMTNVTASVDGTVLAVNAADGERLAAGQTVLTLQPAEGLWLKAEFYGADAGAIRVGMTGEFTVAGGGKSVGVRVRRVFAAQSSDGGRSAGLIATNSTPGWFNGESGRVTLNGPVHSLPAVPTRALILDRGKWWVLLHTDQGNHAQTVVPGPTRGWQTFIEHGLQPGAQVVVENAYLEFHESIAQHYQPPD